MIIRFRVRASTETCISTSVEEMKADAGDYCKTLVTEQCMTINKSHVSQVDDVSQSESVCQDIS